MKPMNLMEAFGALPEEEVARALHPQPDADPADDAEEQPVPDEMPAIRRSPLRIAETLVASAASIAIVAGLIVLIGKIGRAPATPTSTADSISAGQTQTDETDLTVTTADTVQISELYPNAVQLFPENSQACMWFDTDLNPESRERPEVKVAAFPDTVFLRSENNEISMVQNGGETLICGMDSEIKYVNDGHLGSYAKCAYFGDLNFDGFPELCFIMVNRQMPDETYFVAYDVRAKEPHVLIENLALSYQLFSEDGTLYVRREFSGDTGRVEIRGGEVVFMLQSKYGESVQPDAEGALVISKWDTKQYVGEPLDLEGMDIQARLDIKVPGTESYSFRQEFARFYASNKQYWNCWRLDTSAVDFTRPGTYPVYLCSMTGETAKFSYTASDTGEQKSCTAAMLAQRSAFSVTLEPRGGTVVPGTTVTTDPAHGEDKTTPDPFSGVTTAGTKGTASGGTTGSTTADTGKMTETTPRVLNPSELFPKGNQACEWFGGSTKKADAPAQVKVAAFPDLVFTYSDHAGIGLLKNGKAAALQLDTDGLPTVPVNAYFCDLNYDGYPELCTTLSCGSGIIDERIAVCDLHNSKTYSLSDRGKYDYILDSVSGVLYARTLPYMTAIQDSVDLGTYPLGRLEIYDGVLKYLETPASLKIQQTVFGATLVLTEWNTRQFVGKPLDFSGLCVSAKANVTDKYGVTADVSANVSPYDESLQQCWRIDTSGVDFSKPGTYTVYFESIGGEMGDFSYYRTNGTLEKLHFNGFVQRARQAVQITLEQRSDVLSFTDEYGNTDVSSYTFNPIWTGYLKLENVWGADVTYEIGDSAVLEIDTPDTKYLNMGRTLRIAMTGKKNGTTTLTVRTSDGRSKSIRITVKYVNDDLSGETTTD